MPAAYIHENIAKNSLETIQPSPAYIKNNIYAYELGAQGPDFLFYYNVLKFWDKDYSPNELGNDMHNKRIKAFFKAALVSAKNQGDAARAWLAGFVTHYAADTTIHPFVYATTDNDDGSRNLTAHLVLESQFDTWYFREMQSNTGIPRQAICSKKMTHSQKQQVAEALSFACDEIYPEKELTSGQAYKAIDDMNKIISILYSPYKIKHGIFLLIEKIIKKPQVVIRHAPAQKLPESDYLNLNNKLWENPWDRSIKTSYSLPELMEIATELASKYTKTVIDFFSGEISLDEAADTFGNKSYASGLTVEE
jgi:hypothetical protein